MKTVAIALLALALSGCGLNPFKGEELAVPTSLSQTGQEAAKLINGLKVNLIAAKNTLASELDDGLVTRAEAIQYRRDLDDYWKQVKLAEALLSDGKDLLAKGQAELTDRALDVLQKELARRLAAAKAKGTK